MVIDGLGYITNCVVALAFPAAAPLIRPFVPFGTALIGEFPLLLWLMIKGVDEHRWREQWRRSTAALA
jgi:hypothetical protein